MLVPPDRRKGPLHFQWAKSGEYVSQIVAVGAIPLEAA